MKTILVMEEDGAVRESLRTVLEADGYKVMVVSCGPKALAAMDWAAIDLLLLDVTLPLRHGWADYTRIMSRHPSLSVILLNGHTDHARAPLPAGARAFLHKPLDVAGLLELIRHLLEKSRQEWPSSEAPGQEKERLMNDLRLRRARRLFTG